jgi:hypothetical protein
MTASLYESSDHIAGDPADSVSMEIRAQFEGLVLNENDAQTLVYQALLAKVPEGFRLQPDSLRLGPWTLDAPPAPGASGSAESVHGHWTAEAQSAAVVNTGIIQSRIRGQDVTTARTYLSQALRLAAPAQVEVWPSWFDRIPYLGWRMKIVIQE